ncbi:MAG: hypothetical protein VB144_13750 [Clostridia bacterium]|nr:hypothetical protein [Clostridia bacterium]
MYGHAAVLLGAFVTVVNVAAIRVVMGSEFMLELMRMMESMPPALRGIVGKEGLLSLSAG